MFKRIAVLVSVFIAIIVFSGCEKQVENSTSQNLQTQNSEMSAQESVGGQKGEMGDRVGNGNAGRGAGMNSAETKEACVDKSEGDSCQFIVTNETEGDTEITGICKLPGQRADVESIETEAELLCRPDNGDMPSRGNGPAPTEVNITE